MERVDVKPINPLCGGTLAYPQAPIHRLFDLQVQKSPDSVALIYDKQKLSYRDLSARANRLANFLIEHPFSNHDAPIGLLLDRTPDLIVSMLAVMKTGRPYLPLDPSYPSQRLRYMVEHSRTRLVISNKANGHLLPYRCDALKLEMVLFESEQVSIAQKPDMPPDIAVTLDDVAYVIYTSGSTGQPKGVLGLHRGAINRFFWMWQAYPFRTGEVCCQKTSHCFVDSIWEIFGPLLQDVPLVILPDTTVRDPQLLIDTLARYKVSRIVLVPSLLQAMLQCTANLGEVLPLLKLWSCSGEVLPKSLAERFFAAHPSATMLNIYGSSEISADVTWCELHPRRLTEPISIGKPIPNIQIHVLNERRIPLEPGVSGDIYVSGDGLSAGYLHRQDLTDERFVTIETTTGRERAFITGDLGQILPDRTLVYCGRSDQQVKIRGNRVELQEVAAALEKHPLIKQAVVITSSAETHDNSSDSTRLVAYWVPVDLQSRLNIEELREHLQERLPDYMIPAIFVRMEVLPLTPNGKLDRKALPAPTIDSTNLHTVFVEVQNPLQKYCLLVWQQILKHSQIGIHDNFFALGGDSIMAAMLVNKIRTYFQQVIFPIVLFNAPTIEKFSAYLEKTYPNVIEKLFGYKPRLTTEVQRNWNFEKSLPEFQQLIPRLGPIPAEDRTAAKNKKAIFILSAPRSGSTLLRIMLAGNPGLFAPQELELLSFTTLAAREAELTGKYAFWKEGLIRTVMELKRVDAVSAREMIEAFAHSGMTAKACYAWLQELIGERILVDKTVSYPLDIEVLRRAEDIFENAVYLHLIRNPCAVVSSFDKAQMQQVFFRSPNNYSAGQLAELVWYRSHLNIEQFLEQIPSERKQRIVFENLLREPQKILEQTCAKIGMSFDACMLIPYQDQNKKMTDGIHGHSVMLGDFKFLEHNKIEAKVADAWKRTFDPATLSQSTRQLSASLGYTISIGSESDADRYRYLKPIKRTGTKLPLFCVHPGSGSLMCYGNLKQHLDPDRPLWGLQAHGLDGQGLPPPEYRIIAREYLAEIRDMHPNGPYLLGGRCLGAFIAMEMAQQLQDAGETVALLALLDPLRAPRLAAGEQIARSGDQKRHDEKEEKTLKRQFKRTLMQNYEKIQELVDYLRMSPEEKHLQKILNILKAGRKNYQAHVYRGNMALWCNTDFKNRPKCLRGWERVAGGPLEVYLVRGSHYDMVQEPGVSVLASQLNHVLGRLEL